MSYTEIRGEFEASITKRLRYVAATTLSFEPCRVALSDLKIAQARSYPGASWSLFVACPDQQRKRQ
jgi:hypothetical protein